MPGDLQPQIDMKIDAFRRCVEQKREQWRAARDPVGFRQMELDIHAQCTGEVSTLSDEPAPEIIASRSGPVADLVLLGMAAATGDEVRRYLDKIDGLLQRLPTTVLVWSNGEADVFA